MKRLDGKNLRKCLAAFLFVSLISLSDSWNAEANCQEAQALAQTDRLAVAAQLNLQEAKRLAEEAFQKAQEAKARIEQIHKAALGVKNELDKIYNVKSDYDLVIADPEEGSDKLKAHEARLAKMDRIEVQGLIVGYEQREDKSVGGTSYERHFRTTWVKDGKIIGVSYYSKKAIDAAAFCELLQKLVPVVNDQVFKHVQIKRGTP